MQHLTDYRLDQGEMLQDVALEYGNRNRRL